MEWNVGRTKLFALRDGEMCFTEGSVSFMGRDDLEERAAQFERRARDDLHGGGT